MSERMFSDEVALPKHWPDDEMKTASQTKIVVPEGMLKAVADRWPIRCMEDKAHVLDTLETALRWQSENPKYLVPSQRDELFAEFKRSNMTGEFEWAAFVWYECQRRLHLAPESKVGVEDVLNLMLENIDKVKIPIPPEIPTSRVPYLKEQAKQYIRDAIKAYRKGEAKG